MQLKQTRVLEAVFELGVSIARRHGRTTANLDHYFMAIIEHDCSHAAHLLRKRLRTWEISQVRDRLKRKLAQPLKQASESTNPAVDSDSGTQVDLLIRMAAEVHDENSPILNTAHLLMVILRNRDILSSRLLEMYNFTALTVGEFAGDLPPNEDYYDSLHILNTLKGDYLTQQQAKDEDSSFDPNPPGSSIDELLSQFGVDLSRAAQEGKLDPLVGRDSEIERLIQILGRRKKNNPVLIGEPGVGKSAIIEGLALRIAHQQVPPSLYDKRIFALDVSLLVAGTKYRGQFEERINRLIRALMHHPEIILFIDEIHTIVGAGSTQGSLDTANILKPVLARGELQCIGATTLDEYRQYIEADGALERRFQKIIVPQSSASETRNVLERIKEHYERYHGVRYTAAALDACVELTERYMTDRFFPDKAIDVLDEAGSRSCLQHTLFCADESLVTPASSQEATQDQNGGITVQENEPFPSHRPHIEVDAIHIQEVVSSMTGVPPSQLSQGDLDRLQGLYQQFGSTVVGQQEAVKKIIRALQRSRVGLNDPNHPIGVFLFVGPSGVGKTHLAKELARHFFDSEEALIRIDMSEYSERQNVSRLIGSPPGYVGYDEGGQLTERVRRRPYSVLLFDEIEKADPQIFSLMLQLFDEGQLTDGAGRKVDFRNTIIIMTSNAGAHDLQKRGNLMGFDTLGSAKIKEQNREGAYQKALEQRFAPEFLNRIDDIVTFHPLTPDHIRSIVKLELSVFQLRSAALGYSVEVEKAAKDFLAQEGYDPRYGVRSLKRSILAHIEAPLAEMIIDAQVRVGDRVKVIAMDRSIQLQVEKECA